MPKKFRLVVLCGETLCFRNFNSVYDIQIRSFNVNKLSLF